MSNLQSKSSDLVLAADLLHGNGLYPAVAHNAYYCCVQLMKHIWLYSMGKTEDNLKKELKLHNQKAFASSKKTLGFHEFLIKEIGKHIKKTANKDFSTFNNSIWQLKELRTNADYSDSTFCDIKSTNSLTLSNIILPILKKY